MKRLSGDGVAGYSDGKSGAARFNKPRSFAVDLKGNVYVADVKNDRAIRKISDSGPRFLSLFMIVVAVVDFFGVSVYKNYLDDVKAIFYV